MDQKQATQTNSISKATDCQNPQIVSSCTDHAPGRGQSGKYIPVYHVELVRDRSIKVEPRVAINNPDAVVAFLRDELLKSDRERLVSIMLNTKNVVIGIDIVSVGSLAGSVAHPREIFKSAILKNAAAIILVHNLCDAAHKLCYVQRRVM